ncbi:MAG: hypothetical protein M5R42_09840 [Rhodocyclaceae bacterium]|nr:hypothetical protein [Rhodocyclaceae bacterium]
MRDILKILRRRFPSIPVVIYPTPVQGAAARRRSSPPWRRRPPVPSATC